MQAAFPIRNIADHVAEMWSQKVCCQWNRTLRHGGDKKWPCL